MSIPFRLFLLVVVGFVAIWIYSQRQTSVEAWLRLLSSPEHTFLDRQREGSPLNGIPGLHAAEVQVTLRGIAPVPEVLPARREPPSRNPFGNSLYADPPRFSSVPEGELDPAAEGVAREDLHGVADGIHGGDPGWGPDGGDGFVEPEVNIPAATDTESETEMEETIYVVQDRDNLWKIAAKLLGAGHRCEEIRALNADLLRGEEFLRPGMKLRVPRR